MSSRAALSLVTNRSAELRFGRVAEHPVGSETGLPSRVGGTSGRELPPHLDALRHALRRHHVTQAGVLAFGDPRIDEHLPGAGLPLGQLHEVGSAGIEVETGAVAAGFAASLLGRVLPARAVIWIARRDDLYPPGLMAHGLDPARLVLVRPPDEAGVLSAMETALREGGIAAVVGEIGPLGRVASRRLHYACLRHGVTGLALRRFPHGRGPAAIDREATSVATRWHVAPAPGASVHHEPGAARWRLSLTHARGGRPGAWLVEPTLMESQYDPVPPHPVRVVAELADHAADAPAGAGWWRYAG